MAHHHHHEHHNFNKAFLFSIGLNLAFSIIEIIYALIANSTSLLADAVHNLGDVFGLILAWIASWLLTRPTSLRYSYGYKRSSILAALANAILLIITSLIIAYEAVHKLLHPTAISENTVIIVAFIGILINGGTALLFRRGQKDINIKGAYLHLAYDALISAGIVVSAIIVKFSGWLWLDSVVALIVVCIILIGTKELLTQSIQHILDAVPHYIDREGVQNYLLTLPGVSTVHDLHIWPLSTQEVALTAHLVMPNNTLDHRTTSEHLKIHFNIQHVTLQIEQDENCTLEKC